MPTTKAKKTVFIQSIHSSRIKKLRNIGDTAMNKQRYQAIDAMRTTAIILMIFCHFCIFLSSGENPDNFLHFFANHLIGDFAAPIFLFIVGVSLAIAINRYNRRKIILRSTSIIIFGMLLSACLHEPINAFDWDILPLIGIASGFLFLCRKISTKWLWTLCIIIIFITPILRAHINYLQGWGNSETALPFLSHFPLFQNILLDPKNDYQPQFSLLLIIKGMLLNGYFPIFPWITFPIVGFTLGREVIKQQTNNIFNVLKFLAPIFLISGFTLALMSLIYKQNSPINDHLAGFSFYPDSTGLILVQMGIVLIAFMAYWNKYETKQNNKCSAINKLWKKYFQLISRYSLTIYTLHQLMIFWSIELISLFKGNGKIYYENAITTKTAIMLALIFLITIYPLFLYWDTKKAKFSLEWFLSKISNK